MKLTNRGAAAAIAAAALTLILVIPGAVSAAGNGAVISREAEIANWHPQTGLSGQVDGADAALVRTERGVAYGLHATNLTPGNAYTLWIVVVNDPSNCAVLPCTAPEIVGPGAVTDSQIQWAAGHVASPQGTATLVGYLPEGVNDAGWIAGGGLNDSSSAEIHFVLNDHGPLIKELRHDMLTTYRGGCSDSSPFPGIFPDSAISDGAVGPNICTLTMSAIFTAD